MSGCRPTDTPIDPNQKLCDKKEDNIVNTTQYQRMVGKLIYLHSANYCLCCKLITWRSKKQNVVARSSVEAKYRAMANELCVMLWLKKVLEELKMLIHMSIKLYCEYKATISIAQNLVQHDRTEHQIVDIFTKGLHKPSFEMFVSKLGMLNIYAPN
ncbi:Copia protein, partial [Mucuna pruriens]